MSEEARRRAEIVRIAQAMDRAGFAPTKSGNVSARWHDGLLITPSGLPYASMTADDLVVTRWRWRRPRRNAPALVRRAAAQRDLPGTAGRRGHRAYPFAARNGARLHPSRHPGLPLHDRLLRRRRRALRRLCEFRNAGSGRQRRRGARRAQGGAARQSRRRRARSDARGSLCRSRARSRISPASTSPSWRRGSSRSCWTKRRWTGWQRVSANTASPADMPATLRWNHSQSPHRNERWRCGARSQKQKRWQRGS